MITNSVELKLNRDIISALLMAMIVVASVVVGFTIYFNNPSLNQAWSVQQQKDKGLVVGSVHSPEFQFEKNYDNLEDAVIIDVSCQCDSTALIYV